MSKKLITVVDPEGNEHQMTSQNARDMINHVEGWEIKTKKKNKTQIGYVPDEEKDDSTPIADDSKERARKETDEAIANDEFDIDEDDDLGEDDSNADDGGDEIEGEPEPLPQRTAEEWEAEVSNMSRDELFEFAATHFKVKLDKRKGDATLRRDVLELIP